ncbi:MAG: hypothetical protein ACW99A_03830 [Candidatus Kariarchaeaceae archaeon]
MSEFWCNRQNFDLSLYGSELFLRDPRFIDFCYRIGLDYASCSPYRVPVARLAEAHPTFNNPEPDASYRKKLSKHSP